MFVFWYCHKRGKQVRLDREKEELEASSKDGAADDGEGADFDASDTEGDEDDMAQQIASAVKNDRESNAKKEADRNDILTQPDPAHVPLPDTEKGEKDAASDAQKDVGA